MYYVYEHKFEDTQEVFYIGKGCKNRAYSKYRSKKWKEETRGRQYTVSIIQDNLTEDQAYELEKELVEKHKPVCNIAPGGITNGITSSEHQKEFYKTEEGQVKREKLSKRMKENNPMFSEEKKQIQRERNLGSKNFIHFISPESRERRRVNLSESRKGSQNTRARKCIYVPTKKEYGSITELVRENNLDKNISFYVRRNLVTLL